MPRPEITASRRSSSWLIRAPSRTGWPSRRSVRPPSSTSALSAHRGGPGQDLLQVAQLDLPALHVDSLHADLAGLPPLLIHTASGDSATQEAQILAERVRAACGAVTLTSYPVPTHAFHLFWSFLPDAAEAVEQVGQFIREVSYVDEARTS